MLWIYLSQRPAFETTPTRLLHLAPEYCLETRFRQLPNIDYVTADLEAPADLQLDLTDCSLPDESFDLVLCLHILEHIPDDAAAMHELRRIIRPDGTVVLDVPFSEHDETFEPTTTNPRERLRLLGQSDHVRLYGRSDFRRRLEEAGFEVSLVRPVSQWSAVRQREVGVPGCASLHVCRRRA